MRRRKHISIPDISSQGSRSLVSLFHPSILSRSPSLGAEHKHTQTNSHHFHPHCPGSGSDSFFLVISSTPEPRRLLASSKIIPIYPTGCLHKRFRLSDLLRGITDSGFPLLKQNWIHQPPLNGWIQAFGYTPSDTLASVCGVFICVFAYMYA